MKITGKQLQELVHNLVKESKAQDDFYALGAQLSQEDIYKHQWGDVSAQLQSLKDPPKTKAEAILYVEGYLSVMEKAITHEREKAMALIKKNYK